MTLNEISIIVKNIVIEKKIDLVLSDNQYFISSEIIDISNIIIEDADYANSQIILINVIENDFIKNQTKNFNQ